MTQCDAHIDLGGYEPNEFECQSPIDHDGDHSFYDGSVQIRWPEDRASRWRTVGPTPPHVCKDIFCSCKIIAAYMPQVLNDIFESKPLFWKIRERNATP